MQQPTKPGFYWALWTSPARDTHEGGDLVFPSPVWDVVEVWENYIGVPCEADAAFGCEKFGVSVPGVRETQWLDNFQWGPRVVKPAGVPLRAGEGE
jgi:hypothetical protein